VRLHADVFGTPGTGRPIVCLPGLTRNARDFSRLARTLANGVLARPVIALESRGRGRSDRADPATYTIPQELSDLSAALDQWDIDVADFVGTSRGGLLVMLLAATAPERVGRVVLNDIGPTIELDGLERIAVSVGQQMTHDSFEALASVLRQAMQRQFPRLTDGQWLRLARQLGSQNPGGTVTLDYDPALAGGFDRFSHDPAALDFWPFFDRLSDRDVMVVRGAHSDILSAATVEGMRRRHKRLWPLVVPDEGHAPLLWDRFSTEAIRDFLA